MCNREFTCSESCMFTWLYAAGDGHSKVAYSKAAYTLPMKHDFSPGAMGGLAAQVATALAFALAVANGPEALALAAAL